MGHSGQTIGRSGCTTCDITAGYNWFYNANLTPDQICDKLSYTDKVHNPTLSSGLILWDSLENIKMKLIARIQGRNDGAINSAWLNPNQVCLLEVNGGSHWVFLMGAKTSRDYKIYDPFHGDICFDERYGHNITGCAILGKL